MSSNEMNDMLKIVIGLLSRKESGIFREPVDHKALRLTDYPELIKQPRDLGTIKKNIEEGKYKDPQSVAKDIRLVWSNCMVYNRDGSEVRLYLLYHFYTSIIHTITDFLPLFPPHSTIT